MREIINNFTEETQGAASTTAADFLFNTRDEKDAKYSQSSKPLNFIIPWLNYACYNQNKERCTNVTSFSNSMSRTKMKVVGES